MVIKFMRLLTVLFIQLVFLGKSYSSGAQALEIQCKTSNESYEFVIKRSPDTLVTYALLFTTEELETYIPLDEESIQQEDPQRFHYQHLETETVLIDLKSGKGSFSLGWTQFESSTVELNHCHSTAPTD